MRDFPIWFRLAMLAAPFVVACDSDLSPNLKLAPLEWPQHAGSFQPLERLEGVLDEDEGLAPTGLAALPHAALIQLAGNRAGQIVTLSQGSPDSQLRFQRSLVSTTPAPLTTPTKPPDAIEDSPSFDQHEPAPTEAEHLVYDHFGRALYYIKFFPEVPPDAPKRVDWSLQVSRDAPREAIIAAEHERQAELEVLTAESSARLTQDVECEWVGRSAAAHSGYAYCPSRDVLETLSYVALVDQVNYVEPALVGDDFRKGTGLQLGHLIDAGFTGDTPRPGTGNLRTEVALVDQEGFFRAQQHPAFLQSPGGPSRITARRSCNSTSCNNTATTSTGPETAHGAMVLGAFSNVMGGQDPGVTSTSERKKRSYGAPDTHLQLYHVINTTSSYAEAIVDSAFNFQADVIYLGGWVGGTCAKPNSVADIRDAWELAYALGAVGVVPAGNKINRTNDPAL